MAAQELLYTVLKDNANLKAYYRFESDVVDTMGVSNGTATDITYTTGVYGNCAVFNGTSSKIVLPKNSSIQPTGSFSISFWIKTSVTSKDIYSAREFSGNYSGINLFINASGQAYFFVAANTGTGFPTNYYDVTNSLKVINDNAWHHVCAVHTNGSSIALYVDGTVETRTYTAGVAYDASITPTIGFDGSSYFTGSLDEFAIFSTALSADQIKELYEGRFIGEAYPQSGLVAGYHLNGGSTDFSGNNNHGTDTAITYSQANGKFGQGAGFNGSTSYIQPSTSPDFSGNFTIACWIKPTSLGDRAIFGRWTAGCYFLWRVDVGVNSMGLYHYNTWNTNGKHYVGTNPVQVNKWNFVVGVYDNSADSLTIFLAYDNVFKIETAGKTVAGAGAKADSTVKYIGTRGGSDFFAGAMDELLVWNRVLTPREIRKMYGVGTGKYY